MHYSLFWHQIRGVPYVLYTSGGWLLPADFVSWQAANRAVVSKQSADVCVESFLESGKSSWKWSDWSPKHSQNVLCTISKIFVTCRHFMAEGIQRNTVKRIIARYQVRGTTEHRKKSGRPREIAKPTMVHAIDDLISKNPNLSVRAGAQRLKLSKLALELPLFCKPWCLIHAL